MNDAKYIGMDVHTATISAAVRDSSGNLVMEATGRFASRRVCGVRQSGSGQRGPQKVRSPRPLVGEMPITHQTVARPLAKLNRPLRSATKVRRDLSSRMVR
jgi:hypothetical protein